MYIFCIPFATFNSKTHKENIFNRHATLLLQNKRKLPTTQNFIWCTSVFYGTKKEEGKGANQLTS